MWGSHFEVARHPQDAAGGRFCKDASFMLLLGRKESGCQMARYHNLSEEIEMQIAEDRKNHVVNPYASKDADIIRRDMDHDKANLWRPAYVRDVEKILHNPYYNRYSDKTQVFSFYKNDDISRRALHVQLVSRIARNIGSALNLNVDLIEAISLGHDIGHTPFGHAGERVLNDLYQEHTGRFFHHNVHSVRVLDRLVQRNISLQVLDGVLCHNGEMELSEYRPGAIQSFDELDARVEDCYTREDANKEQTPCTLEGCVMRVSDIIAYLGKDRQDAERLGIIKQDTSFKKDSIGNTNPEIINNMIVNIIENSYGKPYLAMTPEFYEAFSNAKTENYNLIYANKELEAEYQGKIRPMCGMLYEHLLREAEAIKRTAEQIAIPETAGGNIMRNEKLLEALEPVAGKMILYRHYVRYIFKDANGHSRTFDLQDYLLSDANDIVVDFIASMTDDYFLDLFEKLFPDSELQVKYQGYFDEC